MTTDVLNLYTMLTVCRNHVPVTLLFVADCCSHCRSSSSPSCRCRRPMLRRFTPSASATVRPSPPLLLETRAPVTQLRFLGAHSTHLQLQLIFRFTRKCRCYNFHNVLFRVCDFHYAPVLCVPVTVRDQLSDVSMDTSRDQIGRVERVSERSLSYEESVHSSRSMEGHPSSRSYDGSQVLTMGKPPAPTLMPPDAYAASSPR